MQISLAKSLIPAGALFYSLLIPPTVRAQQALLDSRATIFLNTIEQKPGAKVLVYDFYGPDGLNSLGVQLADDFSDRLKRLGGATIEVEDRSQLAGVFHSLELEREHGALVADTVAQELSADDVVSGQMTVDNDELTLHLELHRFFRNQLQKVEASLIMDPAMKDLLHARVHDTPQSIYPYAGSDGYTTPSCVRCPNAQFSDEAVKDKIQGSVLLMAIIGPDGRVSDLRVVKGLSDGLSQASLEAVRGWQFKPATDANGTPVAVRNIIEVVFHLF